MLGQRTNVKKYNNILPKWSESISATPTLNEFSDKRSWAGPKCYLVFTKFNDHYFSHLANIEIIDTITQEAGGWRHASCPAFVSFHVCPNWWPEDVVTAKSIQNKNTPNHKITCASSHFLFSATSHISTTLLIVSFFSSHV